MYDYLNTQYEELQNAIHEEILDDINWIFAEATNELPL
jgi:hypothetical protein